MCVWGSTCFSPYKTTTLIICRLVSATGTVLKQPCFAQLIVSDFYYGLDLYLWHFRTYFPSSLAWHSPLKLQVLFSLIFFFNFLALPSLSMVILLQDVFSLGLLLSAVLWILPRSLLGHILPRIKKIIEQYNQQPCLLVDSIQIYSS